ncbi:hypothetical protein CFC21_059110 [Triticum aestivum]|uniref:F-box domain-containing protein n=3 Tax=Triticum aestivum TaxID=4565 RepID=A0A3B6LVY5_WHEAT|nr:hypothetical protein CFC21_059110 [Triticum aestivum]
MSSCAATGRHRNELSRPRTAHQWQQQRARARSSGRQKLTTRPISSDPRLGMSTCVLPDELVVDILSRLPLKSLCRIKCVCKSWLALSSHPYYRQKLPRTPAGLLYQKFERGRVASPLGSAIHLARLPSGDKEIDTTLSFVPCYKYPIQLRGCCNGLLLCYQKIRSEEISNAIVCNPATQEWMALPDTEPGPARSNIAFELCFDPLWSEHFYVFKFQSIEVMSCINTEVKVFFSKDSTWSSCLWKTRDPFEGDSLFVNGVLYLKHFILNKILALDAPDRCTQGLNHRFIQLPGYPDRTDIFCCYNGRLSQSSGVLCYAKQELDGCAIRIWSLEGPDRWVVKHRLSMVDVFGRDMLLRTHSDGYWHFDYDIRTVNLERELVILDDEIADKIISVSISTGKGSQFQKIPRRFTKLYLSLFYVPYYGKFPALAG